MLNASIDVPVSPTLLAFGDLIFDIVLRRVTKGGKPILLRPPEFKVFAFLAVEAQNGHSASHEVIQEYLYGNNTKTNNVISSFIKSIRKALENAKSIVHVETIRDVGYRLVVVPTEYVPYSQAKINLEIELFGEK
jgi:two-component system OmpR family response regulator